MFTGTTTLLALAEIFVTRMLTRDLFAAANLLVNLRRCLTFMLYSQFQCFQR